VLGNIITQMQASGEIKSLEQARELIKLSTAQEVYQP
jgi:hypothetical protein